MHDLNVRLSTDCAQLRMCLLLTLPPSVFLCTYSMITQIAVFCHFVKFIVCLAVLFKQICQIENISHLSELRVLNLAGNSISRVEKLQGLDSLTELHLRHNSISIVVRGLFPNLWQLKAFLFTTRSLFYVT